MTSTHLRRLFSDTNSSAPPSPDIRGSFSFSTLSPLPSVPPSPVLASMPAVPESHLRTLHLGTEMVTSPDSGLAMPHTSPMVLTSDVCLNVASGSQLTQANVAQLPGLGVEIVDDSIYSSSIIDHGKNAFAANINTLPLKANQIEDTDSETTVCAEPMRTPGTFKPFEDTKSESEDLLSDGHAIRPYRMRRPKPVASIASSFASVLNLANFAQLSMLLSKVSSSVSKRFCQLLLQVCPNLIEACSLCLSKA